MRSLIFTINYFSEDLVNYLVNVDLIPHPHFPRGYKASARVRRVRSCLFVFALLAALSLRFVSVF